MVSTVLPSGTRLSLSLAELSSSLPVNRRGVAQVQTPHRYRLSAELRFVLCGFHSPLLTASRLISFPGGNKMFQFSPFAFTIFLSRIIGMSHSAICGSSAACASPQLICCSKNRKLFLIKLFSKKFMLFESQLATAFIAT